MSDKINVIIETTEYIDAEEVRKAINWFFGKSVVIDVSVICDNCGTVGVHDCSEPDNHPDIPYKD